MTPRGEEEVEPRLGFPKDDGWKECTVRAIIDDGESLWFHCYGCHRHRYAEALEWTEKTGVNLDCRFCSSPSD